MVVVLDVTAVQLMAALKPVAWMREVTIGEASVAQTKVAEAQYPPPPGTGLATTGAPAPPNMQLEAPPAEGQTAAGGGVGGEARGGGSWLSGGAAGGALQLAVPQMERTVPPRAGKLEANTEQGMVEGI